VLAETKKWLSRAIMQQAVENRENTFGQAVLHLPETLRFQLNVHIELCKTKTIEMLVSIAPTSDADYTAHVALLLRIK
jgi:hypothetical protein